MFQTSESCIKLHAVAVLELLLSEKCPLLQVCVCVCVYPLLQVCVYLDGQIQRTHFTASYTLYNCACEEKKTKQRANFIKYNKRDKTIIAHHSDPFLAVRFQTSKKS